MHTGRLCNSLKYNDDFKGRPLEVPSADVEEGTIGVDNVACSDRPSQIHSLAVGVDLHGDFMLMKRHFL